MAYYAKGDCDRASADYDKAIQLAPDIAKFYYGRGIVHRRRGDAEKAAADLKTVLELSDDQALRQAAQQELDKLGVK